MGESERNSTSNDATINAIQNLVESNRRLSLEVKQMRAGLQESMQRIAELTALVEIQSMQDKVEDVSTTEGGCQRKALAAATAWVKSEKVEKILNRGGYKFKGIEK